MINITFSELQIIKDIFKKFIPNAEVRAFGSRVSGNSKSYSDLDLLIKENKLTLRTYSELKNAFEESELSFRVDIVEWHNISESFRNTIEPASEII